MGLAGCRTHHFTPSAQQTCICARCTSPQAANIYIENQNLTQAVAHSTRFPLSALRRVQGIELQETAEPRPCVPGRLGRPRLESFLQLYLPHPAQAAGGKRVKWAIAWVNAVLIVTGRAEA